ncbi:hypothetical protein, partial [Klebsiella pneumoniae]|uniref:hypothetical protein n=1 Tax=Klebsiella pneumoniae TaxID=573 RepID=UPI00210C718C
NPRQSSSVDQRGAAWRISSPFTTLTAAVVRSTAGSLLAPAASLARSRLKAIWSSMPIPGFCVLAVVLALRLAVEASPFGDINSMIATLIGIPMH